MIIEKVGDHRVVGHSGGYPGHITRTIFDPAQGLAISVLTNAVDGPATELSDGILRLLDAAGADRPSPTAASEPAEHAVTLPSAERFTGRFANMWGVMDIVALGDRLCAMSPGGANPMGGVDELEITGENTLKVVAGNGFGSVGETMVFDFDADGQIVRVRAGGGMSMWPLSALDGSFAPSAAG